MSIRVGKMVLGMVGTNCYFVYDDAQEGMKDALVFDPGDEGEVVYEKMKAAGLKCAAILLTHGHFDHIWGVQELRGKSGAKVYALDAEEQLLGDAALNVSQSAGRACTVKVNELLADGQEIELAGLKLKVIATPGHTQGSCCYYIENAGILISGDTIFEESVGRTDLPTGSGSKLVRSIQEKLFVLPDAVKVYPGHGDATTIGHEKDYNPYIGSGMN